MWLIQLAYRNIFRNFRRSALSFSAISIGLALIIFSMGFTRGFEQQTLRQVIETRTGDAKIYARGFWEDQEEDPLKYPLEDYSTLVQHVLSTGNVKGVSPRLQFRGNLTDGLDELPCGGIGIVGKDEDGVFPYSESIVKGRGFNEGEHAIVLGVKLANLFGFTVGDQLTVIARTRYEALTALDLEIVGLISTGNPEIDNNNFFMPLGVTQELLEMEKAITEIAVRLDDRSSAPLFSESFSPSKPEIDVVTWIEMTEELAGLLEMRQKARFLINLVLILMAAAGITNTMLMATYERTREIGMMMAVGMKPKILITLFSLESAFIGFFGSILGCLFGGLLTYYFMVNGIDISTFGQDSSHAMMQDKVYAELTPDMIVSVFILGIIVAFIAGLYPTIRASRLKPVSAIRVV